MIWKYEHRASHKRLSSNCRNKRLHRYDWWLKLFWWAFYKWFKNIKTSGKLLLIKEMITQLDFKESYKLVAIDLSKQQALDGDTKVIQ